MAEVYFGFTFFLFRKHNHRSNYTFTIPFNKYQHPYPGSKTLQNLTFKRLFAVFSVHKKGIFRVHREEVCSRYLKDYFSKYISSNNSDRTAKN
jgi:hypothetical protein